MMDNFVVNGICHLTGMVGSVTAAAKAAASRGWGDKINWVSITDARQVAEKEKKYIMVVAHRDNCGPCAYLKRRFSQDPEIRDLSKKFVMVNVKSNEVPADNDFSPDGTYFPRVMFYGPNGRLLKKAIGNEDRKQYRYNYTSEKELKGTMNRVLSGELDVGGTPKIWNV